MGFNPTSIAELHFAVVRRRGLGPIHENTLMQI